tara:strand:+ start:598 stop:813 length:216 start_codon:yes stop_codon:yes gene_type:complete
MIVDKPTTEGIIIDLTGPQGNAFFLIGTAKRFCKQLGYDEKPVIDDMMSGDYENLIEVFEKHFGDFVTMYR